MPATRPEVFVRDSTLATVGDAATWQRLTVVQRLADVGRWTIELVDRQEWELFRTALQEGWARGVVILRGGAVLCSGWADETNSKDDQGRPAFTVSGYDDLDYLGRHLAWPQPTQPIDQQAWSGRHKIEDVVAETRWKEFCQANLVDRLALPGVVVPASQGRGNVASSRTYFRSLLDITQGIHAGSGADLVFDVKQDLSRQIVVDVRPKRDLRQMAQFSPDVGTIVAWNASARAAEYTRIVVAAGREEPDREHRLRTEEPAANRVMRPERFLAAHGVDTSDPDWEDEADAKGDEALVEHRASASFAVVVNETPGMEYGPDYLVGDLVRAWLTDDQGPDDPRVDDVITEAELTWTGGDFGTAKIHVGPKDDPDEYDARVEADLRRRISQLERAL